MNQPAIATPQKKSGKQSFRRPVPGIDMTPMVDLGFLLISFFVMTTVLTKPTVMDLFMPKDGKPSMELGESTALTVMLGSGTTCWYYEGSWEKALQTNSIHALPFLNRQGLRHVIAEKQLRLDNANHQEGRNGLMLLLKAGQETPYSKVIDVLDEVAISMVKKHALVALSEEERTWIAQHQ